MLRRHFVPPQLNYTRFCIRLTVMPKNRVIYLGVLVVAAAALLYLAFKFTQLVQWILPWAAGVGVLLIVVGVFMELAAAKNLKGLAPGEIADEKSAETKT